MSAEIVETIPGLPERLQTLRSCSGDELSRLVSNLHLKERLPVAFLAGLTEEDKTICYRVSLLCHCVTNSVQIPREMQLRVVLADQHKKDTLVSTGTGSDKTLPIALNALLDAPKKKLLSLVVSPLKRPQVTRESDFNHTRYGIPTVVINEDTPREDDWWTENIWNSRNRAPGSARLIIVTVEQLFRSREGHLPRLALLLQNHYFQKYIARVVVDEAHYIYTAGLPHYGLDAFRPAWGRLDELRAVLPASVRWAFFSAILPPHIRSCIEKRHLRSGYVSIHVTSNHPNTMYAVHEVVHNIDNLRNYECFLVDPFSPDAQPRVLIFVDNKELACRISSHLDSCLPLQYQDKGVVRHYHSKMSIRYLQATHEAFTTGKCRILIATSSQSVGVDFPDVKIVCTVGLPGTAVDTLQQASRALRDSNADALFVIFHEPWVHDILLSEYDNGDQTDPDRPRGQLKLHARRHHRAPLSSLRLVKGSKCIRSEFAKYLGDTSEEARTHTTKFCCVGKDCSSSEIEISLQDFLPGRFPSSPPTLSLAPKANRVQNLYRPTQERPFLEHRLIKWLELAHSEDPLRGVRPPHLILSDSHRAILVRAHPSKIKTAQDITNLLGQTSEWSHEWSPGLFEVIEKFSVDYAATTEKSVGSRKRKRE